MSQLDTYLFFNGTCTQAMRFYETTLGGKIEMLMTSGDAPGAAPDAPKDRVLHARLNLGDRILMASDWDCGPTPQPYPGMHGFSLSLTFSANAEAQRIFDLLADGGQVNMPFGETFWSKGFGMLVDKFGTAWMINGEPKQA